MLNNPGNSIWDFPGSSFFLKCSTWSRVSRDAPGPRVVGLPWTGYKVIREWIWKEGGG